MKRRAVVHEHRLEWIRRQGDQQSPEQDDEAPEDGGGSQETGQKAA